MFEITWLQVPNPPISRDIIPLNNPKIPVPPQHTANGNPNTARRPVVQADEPIPNIPKTIGTCVISHLPNPSTI